MTLCGSVCVVACTAPGLLLLLLVLQGLFPQLPAHFIILSQVCGCTLQQTRWHCQRLQGGTLLHRRPQHAISATRSSKLLWHALKGCTLSGSSGSSSNWLCCR